MKRMLSVAAVLVALCGFGVASELIPLSVPEAAVLGATHVAIIRYSDLTTSTTNTAQTISNVLSVAANDYVELVAAVLITPWSVGTTNYTDSCTLWVGDGTDADLFLASMELASDGTEIYVQKGRAAAEAITTTSATRTNGVALVATTTTYTNAVWDSGATTGNISTVTYTLTTAAQASLTAATLASSTYGSKLYTAADKIDFVFTPDASQALDDFTAGEVRVYFKVIRSGRL